MAKKLTHTELHEALTNLDGWWLHEEEEKSLIKTYQLTVNASIPMRATS